MYFNIGLVFWRWVGRVYVMFVWIVFGYEALYCFVIWKMENNNKKTVQKKMKECKLDFF